MRSLPRLNGGGVLLPAGKHIGEHPMSYSVKSVSLGVFLWLRQSGNMALYCNEVSTVRCGHMLPCTSVLSLVLAEAAPPADGDRRGVVLCMPLA